MTDTTEEASVDPVTANTPPSGVCSRRIFVIALLAIGGSFGIAAWIITHSPDPSDQAAILKLAINIALGSGPIDVVTSI